MTNPAKTVPPASPLTGPEATRLGALLELDSNGGFMSSRDTEEMRDLLGRWIAAHADWEWRLFGPRSDKGSDLA